MKIRHDQKLELAEKERARNGKERLRYEIAQKAAREKAEREVAERIAREVAEREAGEHAKLERIERHDAQKITIAKTHSENINTKGSVLPQSRRFIQIISIIGIFIALFWGGSLAVPKFSSFVTTPKVTEQFTFTRHTNVPAYTVIPRATSTKILTPTATTLPIEITDIAGMQMVLVPEGEFIMGSDDVSYLAPERPAHLVYLDAFYIDKYEISNVMYEKCVQSGVCASPVNCHSYTQYGYCREAKYVNYPVINVDWQNATKYCEWVGSRLPTEAEWEKAARGTDGRAYPWGNSIDVTRASIQSENAYFGFELVSIESYPNGTSVYGVFNMMGNASEWVSDWYSGDYYWDSPQRNPKGPDSGRERSIRNGHSWFSYDIKIYSRDRSSPESFEKYEGNIVAYRYVGFRCARDASP